MGDDSQQQRPVRVCLTRCPLPSASESVHSLPCHISHDGPAAIKSYFRPEETSGDGDEATSDKKAWRAEFRGVQLAGERVSLRDMGMQGLVLEDAGMTHEADEGRIWEVDAQFDELMFWQVPNSGDEDTNLPATLAQWSALAHASRSCSPVSRLVTAPTGSWGAWCRRMLHVVTMDGSTATPSSSPSSSSSSTSSSSAVADSSSSRFMPPAPRVTRARGGPRGVTSKSTHSLEESAGGGGPSGNPKPTPRIAIRAIGTSASPPIASSEPSSTRTTRRKRPRTMCRRGSRDLAADRQVVALPEAPRLAPRGARFPTPTKRSMMATVQAAARSRHQPAEKTIRARVQQLLVQFVMLPVVWVSLCCVITAAMGIEALESIQKALCQGLPDGGDDDERPMKRTKREDIQRQQDEQDLLSKAAKADIAMTARERLPHLMCESTAAQAVDTAPTRPRRRRRVLIWDLDETLVLFASLYSGQFARTHNKELAMSVALGEQMMKYLVAVLERHFFFHDLHDADIDHISNLQQHPDESSADDDHHSAVNLDEVPKHSPQYARVIVDRYAQIRAIYERNCSVAVDFLDDPTSQWFTARQALVTSIDTLSTGWIREAKEILELTSYQRPTTTAAPTSCGRDTGNDDEIINVMVTNTQLSPALCKCLIYGLDAHFPIESVYSSSKLHKLHCFQTIMAKYATTSDSDVEFVAIGDGAEEEQVSQALGISFFKIRSLDDLRQLRYALQLVDLTSVSDIQQKATAMPVHPPPLSKAAMASHE